MGDYQNYYFNYELNRHTWRFIVNKQILATYERLLYERRLNEIETRKRNYSEQIKALERQINHVKAVKRDIKQKLNREDSRHPSSLGKRRHCYDDDYRR